jgi:hypothetical protein
MTTAERVLTKSVEVNELQNAALAPTSPRDIGAPLARDLSRTDYAA